MARRISTGWATQSRDRRLTDGASGFVSLRPRLLFDLADGYLIVAPSTAVFVPPPCWVKRGRTTSFCGLMVKRTSVLR